MSSELVNQQIALFDIQDMPIIRTWHVVALTKRSASQPTEAVRYFTLEKGCEVLTTMFSEAA